MSKTQYSKLLLAVPILLIGSGAAYALTPNTLGAPSVPVAVSYTLPNVPGAPTAVILNPSLASTFVYVSGTSNVNWLTYSQSATSGSTAGSAATFTISPNAVAATMQPGTYSGTITFSTTTPGYASGTTGYITGSSNTATVTVILSVKGQNAKFACTALGTSNTTGNLNVANMSWNTGPLFVTLSCTSSGEEIGFSVAPGGNLGSGALPMTASPSSGIAYAWGSAPITVTVPQQLLLSTPQGNSLTGTITVTPTNGTPALVFNVNVNLAAAALAVSSIAPAELPVDTVNNHTVVITGTGFLPGGGTKVSASITSATAGYADITSNVVVASSTQMIVTLTSTYVGQANTVYIKTFQSDGSTVATGGSPTGVLSTIVTTKPIIYTVVNSASFQETCATCTGTIPAVAPYELISIFGANFAGPTEMVSASPSALPVIQFPSTLAETLAPSAAGNVIVKFYSTNTGTTFLANAPLIFVSANQINAIVPQEVGALAGTASSSLGVHVVVSVGSGPALSNTNVPYFPLDVAAASPGIFTPSGSGRGASAVMNYNATTGAWSLNTAANPAVHGQTVAIYATGLGDPQYGTSGDQAIGAATPVVPASCITTAGYLSILNGPGDVPSPGAYGTTLGSTLTLGGETPPTANVDGLVIQSLYMMEYLLPPCLQAGTGTGNYQVLVNPTAAVPNPVTPSYVGFVADSIAGLYQINLTLPSGTSWSPAAVNGQIPIQIVQNPLTSGVYLSASQTGATIYVQ